jgi:hypothetical protein
MMRSILAFAAALLLGACGSIPVERHVLAAKDAPAVSDEMDCMADCLQDTTENCESCADSCLRQGPSPAVASTP